MAAQPPQRVGEESAGEPARADRAEGIAERLAELLGEPLTGPLEQLSGGASRATFTFATASHGELVVQIERRAAPEREARAQAVLLLAAAQAGVPVARVVAHGGEDPA